MHATIVYWLRCANKGSVAAFDSGRHWFTLTRWSPIVHSRQGYKIYTYRHHFDGMQIHQGNISSYALLIKFRRCPESDERSLNHKVTKRGAMKTPQFPPPTLPYIYFKDATLKHPAPRRCKFSAARTTKFATRPPDYAANVGTIKGMHLWRGMKQINIAAKSSTEKAGLFYHNPAFWSCIPHEPKEARNLQNKIIYVKFNSVASGLWGLKLQ